MLWLYFLSLRLVSWKGHYWVLIVSRHWLHTRRHLVVNWACIFDQVISRTSRLSHRAVKLAIYIYMYLVEIGGNAIPCSPSFPSIHPLCFSHCHDNGVPPVCGVFFAWQYLLKIWPCSKPHDIGDAISDPDSKLVQRWRRASSNLPGPWLTK